MSAKIYFVGTPFDEPYLQRLKSCVADASVRARLVEPDTVAEIELFCKKNEITQVVSTSQKLLQKLLLIKKNPAISNYAGSIIQRNGIEYLFIDPLKQLQTVPYGKFITTRYISKFSQPERWKKVPQFQWELLTQLNAQSVYDEMQSAFAVAVDIETVKEPELAITCIGYTAIYFINGKCVLKSYVLPMDSEWALAWMRKFNWEVKAPKILQNGKYDIAYLARYNAVLYNYLWDTAAMQHCWYSELPKDLASLSAFHVRNSMYWKDLAQTNDLMEYYRYNALDTYGTALVFLNWICEAPQWAKNNYVMEFPLAFPCHLCEMTGVKRDMDALTTAAADVAAKVSKQIQRLQTLVATPGFNANSPKQVGQLLKVLGCEDIKSTEEKYLKKAALRHPINGIILNLILDIRGNNKLLSTYLKEGKEFNGKILYSLTPWATDTGRLASKEHHFWCGLQIQNIPRGKEVKQTIRADDGFALGECDLEQAESRDTAYISGDTNLIAAVESSQDFHSRNASAFFGVPYDKIYCDELHKTIDKVLRDLSKRVNHGANYNMGPDVLVDTMGEDKVREAQKILKLNRFWTLRQVAEFLLGTFHKTYPMISKVYYPWVISTVETTHMLVGATGWTRYCFGNPRQNKLDLNALVAHNPQSLNAMKLNKAFMRVFYEIAMHPEHSKNFKLLAQIHDSIFFQFRIGHEYLCKMVADCMKVPLTIKACTGVTYTYTVPAAIKAGPDGKGATHWHLTE